MRARIVGAFAAFGLLLGLAFVALAWGVVHGAASLFPHPLYAAIGGGAIIALLGLALGRYTANRVLAPVEELGEIVDTHRPEELAEELGRRTYDREIESLARRLEETMRRLQEGVEREQRFTRFASHELRSPVAVLRGAAELLAAMPEVHEGRACRPLERIERSIADMESIIQAFVWLGRERAELDRGESADVAGAVRETVARYRYLLEDKPVSLDVREEAQPVVEAPPAVLDLVVGNLVANAFHYTDRGEVVVEIGPHSVSVTDSGPGIPNDQLESAGDSFVRGNRSVGYGLGLSIVHSLSERFGWRLWIDSDPGEGTTATLYFHALRAPPAELRRAS